MRVHAALLALSFSVPALADPLARARDIARTDPWLERALANEARTPGRADVLAVEFANAAGDPIAVRAGSLGSVVARVRTSAAHPSTPIHWNGGVGSYAHAPGVTGFWVHAGDVLEQLLLVERPGASALEWSIELRDDIRVKTEATGAFVFVRSNGDALLRLPPAWALDGSGRHVAIPSTLRQEGQTLHVRFDLSAIESFPALVDPALESVLWFKPTLTGATPPKRLDHSLAYDPIQHQVVLFGGEGPGYLNDTWTYDGSGWTKITTTTSPSPRSGAALGFVPNPSGMLLFGGYGGTYQGDTWRFDGANWNPVTGPSPSPRSGAGACFAPVIGGNTDSLVLFGGGGASSAPYTDTWHWSNGWTESNPLLSPEPALGNALAYDTHHQAVLTIGGGHGPIKSDTFWSYDGTIWTNLPSPAALERRYTGFAFDSDRQTGVLFGGEAVVGGQFVFVSTTWEWDAKTGTWMERVVTTKPTSRAFMSLAYDANRKRVVLFGGFTPGAVYLNDTWEYQVVNGTCTTSDECGGATCVDGACCVSTNCGTCSACSSTTGACAPVLNADDPDSCTGNDTCDSNGECKLKPGEPCTGASDCASLFCADGVCCNSPCQGACEACDLSTSSGTCTLVTGDARHGTCIGEPPCGSTCTGNSPNCAFSPDGTPCGSSCESASLEASSCDGSGVCTTEAAELCANHFACLDGQSCRTSCTKNEHCQAGYTCRDNACVVPGTTCVDAVTSVDEAGPHDCTPYVCASGECARSCLSAAQCASGFVCNDKGVCIAPGEDEQAEDDGCGCQSVGREPGSLGWLSLVLIAFLRRRRHELN